MKMKNYILFGFAIFLIASCTHENNDPGYAYMPDMAYSNAYEAYSENPVFANGQSMQLPVEGTVPREMIPYPYEPGYDGQILAGQELVNPMEPDQVTLAQGKEKYGIYCMVCHGEQGKGDGHLYTSKLFTAKPSDLTAPNIQDKPDGEIFHIITRGSLSRLMGPHGGQIKPEDRWKIVTYVKNEL